MTKEKEIDTSDDQWIARELSSSSNIPELEIKRVLSFFPQVDKYQENISKLTDLILGTLSHESRISFQTKNTIKQIEKQLYKTRWLNETYMGHMTPQPIIPAIWGNMISGYINANSIAREASQAETEMEPEAIGYLIDIIGYKKGVASGVFVTGGTEANHTALTVARLMIEKGGHETNKRIQETTKYWHRLMLITH